MKKKLIASVVLAGACAFTSFAAFGCGSSGSKASKAADVLASQKIDGVAGYSKVKIKSSSKDYAIDAESGKKAEKPSREREETDNINLGVKGNISTMSLDIDFAESYGDDDNHYEYMMLRGGDFYYCGEEEEIDDFKGVEAYKQNLYEMDESGAIEWLFGELSKKDKSVITVASPLGALLNLANAYNSTTVAKDSITINANLLMMNIYNDVKATAANVNSKTTVGELLALKPVKTLLQSVTYWTDAKTVYDAVKSFVPEDYYSALPVAKSSQTVYEYIIEASKSKELMQKIAGTSAVDAIANFQLGDLVKLIGGDEMGDVVIGVLDDLKTYIDKVDSLMTVSETKTVYSSSEDSKIKGFKDVETFTLENVVLIYTVNNKNQLTGVSFTADITDESTYVYEWDYSLYEFKMDMSIEAKFEFKDEAQKLINVKDLTIKE